MKPAAAMSVNAKDLHASAIYFIFRFGAAARPAPESEIAAAEAAAAHAHHHDGRTDGVRIPSRKKREGVDNFPEGVPGDGYLQ